MRQNHGLSKTSTYDIWSGMRCRCLGSHPSKKNYKDKGIGIDPRWDSYLNFLADMGERPGNLTLDRIDSSKGYSKDNCRWATRSEQNRNTSRNKKYEYKGQVLCVSEIARLCGVNERTLHWRLSKGMPLDLAIFPQKYNRHGQGGKYLKTVDVYAVTDGDLRSSRFR